MNVIVVDDHPLVRVGLSSALKLEKNIEKIYEASNIQDTIKILTMNKIEIAIVDLRLANESGLELIRIAKIKTLKQNLLFSHHH
ncbi:response regulator [Caloramator sp. Dgby_cultured_2]|uniref:response regulator n=1 Tax=Caloramator sp. Dgby_cultured_2 TaxID=3029174 RepID=UPI00237DC37D|nr:response regulator [Caloramator sp. Dgby_cultured_2]WDU82681.1 response regulator [Caloramator sp. Dgby_cultured_2]